MTLPTVGGTNNSWGTVLNTFLLVSHNTDGTLRDAALENADVVQSTTVRHMVVLSQASYDGLTPDNDTLYIII